MTPLEAAADPADGLVRVVKDASKPWDPRWGIQVRVGPAWITADLRSRGRDATDVAESIRNSIRAAAKEERAAQQGQSPKEDA